MYVTIEGRLYESLSYLGKGLGIDSFTQLNTYSLSIYTYCYSQKKILKKAKGERGEKE